MQNLYHGMKIRRSLLPLQEPAGAFCLRLLHIFRYINVGELSHEAHERSGVWCRYMTSEKIQAALCLPFDISSQRGLKENGGILRGRPLRTLSLSPRKRKKRLLEQGATFPRS